jgi:hypothetical protein
MESMQAMKASMPKADDNDDNSRVESSIRDSELDEHASSDSDEDQEGLRDTEDDGSADWEFDGVGLSSSTDASDTDDSVNPCLGSRSKLDLQCMNRLDLRRRSHPL